MAQQETNPLLADMHPDVAAFWAQNEHDYDCSEGLCDVTFEFKNGFEPIIEMGAPCHYCLNNKYSAGRRNTSYISTSLRGNSDAYREFYQFICDPIDSPWRLLLKDSALIYREGQIVAVRLKITKETDAQLLGNFCIASRLFYEYDEDYSMSEWWGILRKAGVNQVDTLYTVLVTYKFNDSVFRVNIGDGHYPIKHYAGVHYRRFINGQPKLKNRCYLNGADYDGCSSIFDDENNNRIVNLIHKKVEYHGIFQKYRKMVDEHTEHFAPVDSFISRLKEELPKWREENE